MAQKKKRKAQRKACNSTAIQVKNEIAEEILALSSIFAEEFLLHSDGVGFGLSVVPHPGSSDENYTSLNLDIRYTAGYPSTPLQLRLSNVTGLSADDIKLLEQQLHVAAAAFAEQSTVCVFNLVGLCQEYLLDRNDAAREAARACAEQQQQEEKMAAVDAAGGAADNGCRGSKAEAQSLWHEMQQRMQAQGEAETSVGLGASIPSSILGEDLWMFNAGLFTDEGEAAYTVPNLSCPAVPASSRTKRYNRGATLSADKSPGPSPRLKASGQLLDSPSASSLTTPDGMQRVAGATGGKSSAQIEVQEQDRAGNLQAPQDKGVLPGNLELANITLADSQQQGLAGSVVSVEHTQSSHQQIGQQMQMGSSQDSTHNTQRLLLSQNLNCSFSNLPKGLQQLLSSSSRSKRNSAKQRHKKKVQEEVQESKFLEHHTSATDGPRFGDFDSGIFERITSSESVAAMGRISSNSDNGQAQQGGVGPATGSVDGEVFRNGMSAVGASSLSDEGSDTSSDSVVQTDHGEGQDSEEGEGVSLRSQLLTGYLLLLAAGANGANNDAAFAAQAPVVAQGLHSSSSAGQPLTSTGVTAPASLLPLADHLLQAGLLSKWVHWLLQQLPRRPELFQRAFKRLFQQEIQGCSSWQSGPMLLGDVVQQFWERQVPAAATAAVGSAMGARGTSQCTDAALPTAPAAGAAPQGATAPMLSAAGAANPASSQAAVSSRYRSDFQELQPLGRGGFGIVVAAINRLDGRKYAVKKIKLQPNGGSSHARILREVATLSRLQHPNIVRYFQAWTEEASADGDADFWRESDGGEWGYLRSSEESEEETRESTYSITGEEELKQERDESRAAFSTSPDDSASTQWASGASKTTSNSRANDGDTTCSSSTNSSGDEGILDMLEVSIPPHLPPALSPAKQQPMPMQERKKPTKDPKPSGRRQHTRSAGPGQILYIQMEFCPRTLAQVLEAGSLDEADAWLVLRGILAGLAHIHAQGAIHRDLKPANIFYDSKGDIKLGDFGLAKFNTASAAGSSSDGTSGDGKSGSPNMSGMLGQRRLSSVGGVASAAAPSDVTGVCGTGLYISPEIANGWASYNEKVDLYSLGVVVFEMWHPFGTAMERLAVLRELREAGRMPPDWEAAHPQVARLVRWLMSPKPADRPSARQVLQSDLLPPRLEDEQLKDLLRSLPDNPVAYERVIDSLFSIGSSKEQQQQQPLLSGHQLPGISAAAGDGAAAGLHRTGFMTSQQASLSLSELPGAPIDCNLELEAAVCKVVKTVCSVHGAVQLNSTSLGLSHAALPRDAVRFLAPSGDQMALRYEIRYPLAVWFAQQAAMAAAVPFGMGSGAAAHHQHMSAASAVEGGLKRFEVCRVNRAGRGGRGLPASYLQADFDILVPAGTATSLREKMLVEAEVLKVVTQVLEALPDLGGYEVRLGHTQLFAASIAGMCLPPEVTPASVMALLSSAISISAATPGGQGTADTAGPTAGSGSGAQGLSTADKLHTAAHGPSTAGSSSSTGRASMWPAVRAGLDGLGLDAKPVSRCRQCTLKLPGQLTHQLGVMRSFLHELRPQLGSAGLAAAMAAVDELEALGQLLVDWGLAPDHILLEPLLTPPSDYYGGVLFQVLLRSAPAQSSTLYTSAAAAGGRYDGLLRSLWSPAAASIMPAPWAVGVSINCDKLIKALLQRRQHRGDPGSVPGAVGGLSGAVGLQGGRLQTGQCDVLVCVKGGDGMLQLRMQLLAQLWSAGISAALLPREAPSLTEQYEYAHGLGARWLVILDSKTIGPNQLVRVKSLERKGEDASIHVSDLGRFLQLGLSGAQDLSRSIATSFGLLISAPGHSGNVSYPASGASSSVGGIGASQGQGHRLLQRFASDGRLGSAGDSIDSEFDIVGSREGGAARDRELQGGRHRDRRR